MSVFGIKKITAGKLIAVFVLFAGLWQCYHLWFGLTSDAKLIGQFRQHRGNFVQLRQMALDDDLKGRIGIDYVDDRYLPPGRVAEYRHLMEESGVKVMEGPGGNHGQTGFMVDSRGILGVIAGSSKGIAFCPQPPKSPVVSSLDKSCLSLVGPDATVCAAMRHIEDNWWLWRIDAR